MTMALEIKGLTKEYPGFRLDGLNLELPKGCILGLIGENGAGKSTTIRLILGLAKADDGEVRIDGVCHDPGDRDWKELVGVVHDESFFPEGMNAEQLNKVLKRIYRTWDEATFHGYLNRFRLPEKKAFKEYSRGMKMKLAIGAALSHDSRLLILDEATSGLDPVVRDEILEVFREYIQDEEKSILMSSHIVSDLEKVCDYIAFIHQGKLVFNEEKDLLKEQYRIIRCSKEELAELPKEILIGSRENAYGAEALIRIGQTGGAARIDRTDRNEPNLPTVGVLDPATIEDIMLYTIKEGRQGMEGRQ